MGDCQPLAIGALEEKDMAGGDALAESGYNPVNPPEWIANPNPQLIHLSLAADDYNGLPSPETIQVIRDYTLLRTDQNGWIKLTTDGEQMWVEGEKR